MVALMRMASITQDLTVVERANAVVAAAVDHLRLPPSDLAPTSLAYQLDELRQRLEQQIALSAEEPTQDSPAQNC